MSWWLPFLTNKLGWGGVRNDDFSLQRKSVAIPPLTGDLVRHTHSTTAPSRMEEARTANFLKDRPFVARKMSLKLGKLEPAWYTIWTGCFCDLITKGAERRFDFKLLTRFLCSLTLAFPFPTLMQEEWWCGRTGQFNFLLHVRIRKGEGFDEEPVLPWTRVLITRADARRTSRRILNHLPHVRSWNSWKRTAPWKTWKNMAFHFNSIPWKTECWDPENFPCRCAF